jgi:hypothetical protein
MPRATDLALIVALFGMPDATQAQHYQPPPYDYDGWTRRHHTIPPPAIQYPGAPRGTHERLMLERELREWRHMEEQRRMAHERERAMRDYRRDHPPPWHRH